MTHADVSALLSAGKQQHPRYHGSGGFYRLPHSHGENKTPNLSEIRFALSVELVSLSQDTPFNSIFSQGEHAHLSYRGQPGFQIAKLRALASQCMCSPGCMLPEPSRDGGDLGNLLCFTSGKPAEDDGPSARFGVGWQRLCP